MTADYTAQITDVHIPTIIERRVAFNPNTKKIVRVIDNLTFKRGSCMSVENIDIGLCLGTSITDIENIPSVKKLASNLNTSITEYKQIWKEIPTLDDYVDHLDFIDDLEETEIACYDATKRLGW